MNHFGDKPRLSRQPLSVAVTVLVLFSLLLQPITLFAKPAAAPFAEELVIDAPTLRAPANGAITTGVNHPPVGVPKLEWEPLVGAQKYGLEVSTSAGFASILFKADTYGTTHTLDRAVTDGEYFWRVRAYDGKNWGPYSEIRSFIKDWSDSGNFIVELVSPPEGAERTAFTEDDFLWQPMPGAALYRFQIATDPSFTNVVYTAKTIKAQHTPIKRLPNNLYYWRVTPIDNRENFGAPSAVRSFSFTWSNTPVLLSPVHDVDLAFVPRFTWTAVEAASKYELQISTQPDFSLKDYYQTAHTDYTPEEALSNDQDYYWRVKAIDSADVSSPWSEVRRFRAKWNFQTQPLAPVINSIKQTTPFFAWTPIPGAERYQLRVASNTAFSRPLMDRKYYNATTSAVTHPETSAGPDQDYYWQVRGIDAQENYTPWSDMFTFRFGHETVSPNLIYPLPYYTPDSVNMPVHSDRTIATPLFVWDSALVYDPLPSTGLPPAYYELTVASDLAFQNIQFQIATTGPAAAPTLAHPFINLQDGALAHWRVRAYKLNGEQIGVDQIWTTRIDRTKPQLPAASIITPIYPRDGFESVISPPLFGWLPVEGAANYRVQVSSDPNFNTIVDEAAPQFLNYAPWQGRLTTMPFGTYWWRVRAESAPGVALGGWSEVRRFNLSTDIVMGNPKDLVPPEYPKSLLSNQDARPIYTAAMSYIASSALSAPTIPAGYDVGDLHIMTNRVALRSELYPEASSNLNWIFAFSTAGQLSSAVKYGIYVDIDHIANAGASIDPLGKAITVDSLYLPDYVLYVTPAADGAIAPNNIMVYNWLPQAQSWDGGRTLTSIGGDAWFSTDGAQAIQLEVPYSALGAAMENFSGSLAVTVFSTAAGDNSGMVDMIPPQGAAITRPAFVSNMLMPLYPFDTPLSNPITHYDLPTMRWRMPYYDSADGYQVQVARDAKFTQLVETWDISESAEGSFYPFLSNNFQSVHAYEDNESFYWRVRLRHEKYNGSQYDHGPWSPAMRFKLDSRLVGNPRLSTGPIANTTPTFEWDRVEGASAYKLQIDDDANFSSPLVRVLSGTSYTPIEPLKDGTHYWRVAIMRSDDVTGRWTPTMSFVKQSLAPVPLAPISDPISITVINAQPTFLWTAILTPTAEPRVATPLYRLQIDRDPNFGKPANFTTAATALTLPEEASLADGNWYWRVAAIDFKGNIGAYSPVQQFYKEYLAPQLLQPSQNSVVSGVTSFEWAAVPGAAYYGIEIDDDPLFNSSLKAETDNTKYTPIAALPAKQYHWRVRIFDDRRNPGPFVTGRIQVQTVSLSLGNYVWIDDDNDGAVNGSEPPVPDGVVVELLSGAGSPLNKTVPTVNGYYRFDGLDIGEYRVRLAASNFATDGLLQQYSHSTGANQEGDPNLDVDQKDNGQDTTEPAVDGIVSAKLLLNQGEPTGELPTPSGTPGDDGAGTADADSNLTLDFGVVPSAKLFSLGNFVGADANNDGQIDVDNTQKPVPAPDGVLLELLSGDSTALLNAAASDSTDGVTILRTTTTKSGYYLFSGLPAGSYRLRIAASNFASGGVLANYQPSNGADQEADPNNNGDQNDNGLEESNPAVNGITSGIITLGDNEPTGEVVTAIGEAGNDGRGTLDANANLTIDFGLMPGKPTAANQWIYLPVIRR